jgi:hypothetical protein
MNRPSRCPGLRLSLPPAERRIQTHDLLHRQQTVTDRLIVSLFRALVPEIGGKSEGRFQHLRPECKRNRQRLKIPVETESID